MKPFGLCLGDFGNCCFLLVPSVNVAKKSTWSLAVMAWSLTVFLFFLEANLSLAVWASFLGFLPFLLNIPEIIPPKPLFFLSLDSSCYYYLLIFSYSLLCWLLSFILATSSLANCSCTYFLYCSSSSFWRKSTEMGTFWVLLADYEITELLALFYCLLWVWRLDSLSLWRSLIVDYLAPPLWYLPFIDELCILMDPLASLETAAVSSSMFLDSSASMS